MARVTTLRIFPRISRSREGSRGNHPVRRCSFLLGHFYQTLARRFPPAPSRSNRRVLRHRAPLVHPLRPPQSRFLPHLHHRTQFQALPHPRIPAPPALLVLRPRPPHRISSVDSSRFVGPVFSHHRISSAQNGSTPRLIPVELFTVLPTLLFGRQIETSRLCSSCDTNDEIGRASCRERV